MTPAAADQELVPAFDLLLKAACAAPGHWQFVVLESGWKFMVLCTSTGQHALRFRCGVLPATSYIEFLAEAQRCARLLGAGRWRLVESARSAFWEVSFTMPAELPATPEEAA